MIHEHVFRVVFHFQTNVFLKIHVYQRGADNGINKIQTYTNCTALFLL